MAGIFDFLFGNKEDPNAKEKGILGSATGNDLAMFYDQGPGPGVLSNPQAPPQVAPQVQPQAQAPVDPNSFSERFKNAGWDTHLLALARGLGAAGSRDPMKTAMEFTQQDLEMKRANTEAEKAKIQMIPGTPYAWFNEPGKAPRLIASKEAEAYLVDKQLRDIQLWKQKTDYKADADVESANRKLGGKQSLEDTVSLDSTVQDANTLSGIAAQLRKLPGPTSNGGVIGMLPKGARDVIDPATADLQQKAEMVALKSLKPIMGAQFTENEGKQFMARYFNPRLPAETNAANLERMGRDLVEMAKDKANISAHMSKHGTLEGYKPGGSTGTSVPPPNTGGASSGSSANPSDSSNSPYKASSKYFN